MGSPNRLQRRRRLAVGGLVLVATGLLVPARSGAAGDLGGYVGSASASGGRITFTVPGFVAVENVIDGGGPASQAAVDAQGAASFASLPYPGDTAIAFPGLFTAVTGQTLPSGYPFYVSASHPTVPQQELKDPTGSYALLAEAAAGTASGIAQLRGQGPDSGNSPSTSGGTWAATSAVVKGDTITVTAETVNEALNAGGGTLRIASVRSRSVTTYIAGATEPVTETALTVEGGAVGGMTFAYGPNGLTVGSSGVPIPARAGLDQLNAALAPSGISIGFGRGQKLAGGASADALELRLQQASPGAGIPGGIVTVRFGGATTTVTVGQGLGPGLGAPATLDPVASRGAAPAPAGDPTPANFETPSAPTTGGVVTNSGYRTGPAAAPFGTSLPASGGTIPSSPDSPLAPAAGPSVASGNSLAQPILQPRDLGSDGFLYGTLLAGGLVMLALSSLWRGKGMLRP